MSTRQPIDWRGVKSRLQDSQASLAGGLVAVAGEKLKQVFCQRARQLAARSADVGRQEQTYPVLTFTVGTERLCIELTAAAEIVPFVRCSPIPGAGPELLGVINVRGRICSVLDLARILDLAQVGDREGGYIVLVRHEGVHVGLKVDEIEQIEMVSSDASGDSDWGANGRGARFATGKDGLRATLFNVEEIIARGRGAYLDNPLHVACAASP